MLFRSEFIVIWDLLSWPMAGIALAGTIINAEKNKWGFVFWLVSNLYMSINFFFTHQYANCALFIVYFALAIRGFWVWNKKESSKKKDEVCDA